jgi:hypothetical protein
MGHLYWVQHELLPLVITSEDGNNVFLCVVVLMEPEVDRVNCYWPSPAQSFFVPSPSGPMALYYYLTIPGVIQFSPQLKLI